MVNATSATMEWLQGFVETDMTHYINLRSTSISRQRIACYSHLAKIYDILENILRRRRFEYTI